MVRSLEQTGFPIRKLAIDRGSKGRFKGLLAVCDPRS